MPSATQSAPASAQHGLTEHSHGAGVVPIQSRAERPRSAVHADFPPVTGREGDWKLTPVAKLGELLDGPLDGSRYEFRVTGDGASVSWTGRDDERIGTAGLAEDRAAANAWSRFGEALSVRVPPEGSAHVTVSRSTLGSTARAAHTIVEAGAHSSGMVVLQNDGDARLSENVEIIVGDGANLTVVSVQEWADDALHLASHFARIGRDASLTHIVVNLGGEVVRVNPSAHLAEQGANAELLGMYFAASHQHLEQRVYVNHDAPHSRSRVTYKGALDGAGARTVWVGDVLIGRDAVGTDSYEQNRNLVLSEGTRADSIPNLEIETGEIEGAGHASATGRFDDEQLFYLASRGIPESEARRLVVIGFLNEVIQAIGDDELQSRLLAVVEASLDRNGAR